VRKFWKRRGNLDLERDLRAARPEPRPEFLRTLADRVGERRRPYRGVRMALAASVAAILLVAVASVGGIGRAASAGHGFVKVATSIAFVHTPSVIHKTAAADQYPPPTTPSPPVTTPSPAVTTPAPVVTTPPPTVTPPTPVAKLKVCRNGRVVSIPADTIRATDKKVSASAKVGSKCGAKPKAKKRKRGKPAFTG
jgi:hypothetical protein